MFGWHPCCCSCFSMFVLKLCGRRCCFRWWWWWCCCCRYVQWRSCGGLDTACCLRPRMRAMPRYESHRSIQALSQASAPAIRYDTSEDFRHRQTNGGRVSIGNLCRCRHRGCTLGGMFCTDWPLHCRKLTPLPCHVCGCLHAFLLCLRLKKLPLKRRLGALDNELGRVNRMLLRRMQTRYCAIGRVELHGANRSFMPFCVSQRVHDAYPESLRVGRFPFPI